MAIDPNIALQYKAPQFDNPLAQMAQFSAVQNAQNQNQLAQYTLSKAKREDEDTQAVRNLLTGAGGDLEKGKNALMGAGYYKQALELGKTQLEQQEKQSTIGKNNAAADKSKFEISTGQRTQLGQTLGALAQMPNVTPQIVATAIQHHGDMFGVPPERLQASLASIPQDPAQLKAFLDTKMKEVMKPEDLMKYTTPDANTVANNRQSGANNAATVGATVRGQDMTDGRSREANANGKVPAGYRYNAAGDLEPIPGGPAAAKSTEQQKAASDANSVLGLLDMAEPLLKQATNSYAGTAVDKVAQAVGVSTEGAQASAQLKALEGSLVAKMPKMSGPQSDKDVLLYRQMAGQIGDSTLPAETRMAAVKVIRQLNQKYIADNGGTPQARVADAVKNGEVTKLANARPVSVKSAADYAKLPSGTVYMAPDGSMRTKQ